MNKQVNLKQLALDGIAQLKTKRQLVNEGILTKSKLDGSLRGFNNVKNDAGYYGSEMKNSLGKSLKIQRIDEDSEYVSLIDPKYNTSWAWPIECIAK